MAKSYEPCFSRTNKAGGKYTTCVGSQKKTKTAKQKKIKGIPKKKKKAPEEYKPKRKIVVPPRTQPARMARQGRKKY